MTCLKEGGGNTVVLNFKMKPIKMKPIKMKPLQNEAHRPHPDVLNFPKFSDEKAGWLVWPFDEAEILRWLRILKGAKLLAQMIFLWLFSKLVGKLLDHIC